MSDNQLAPVYPELHYEGVKFRLYSDGRMTAQILDEEPEEIGRLTFADTGNPWIPKHKNFNSLCKQMVREGDLDELLKRKERRQKASALAKKHAEELLAALQDMLAEASGGKKSCGHDYTCVCAGDKARSAIRKATGGAQ